MNCLIRASQLLTVLCVLAFTTNAQTTSAPEMRTNSSTPSVVCSQTASPTFAETVQGAAAPYSADEEWTSTQTLVDGTHITQTPNRTKIYRDSQGRVRVERPFCLRLGNESQGTIIEIRDPVAGYSYILDEQNHVAHRFALEAKDTKNPSQPATPAVVSETAVKRVAPVQEYPRPTTTKESLGSQTMEGLLVEGTRITRTIPEGLMGNDRPMTDVTETWTSPELKLVVLNKRSSLRFGELTMRLTNIDLSNPILALFQPPADYKIVDETGNVTLTFTRD